MLNHLERTNILHVITDLSSFVLCQIRGAGHTLCRLSINCKWHRVKTQDVYHDYCVMAQEWKPVFIFLSNG